MRLTHSTCADGGPVVIWERDVDRRLMCYGCNTVYRPTDEEWAVAEREEVSYERKAAREDRKEAKAQKAIDDARKLAEFNARNGR